MPIPFMTVTTGMGIVNFKLSTKLFHDEEGYAYSWMTQIKKEVLAIDIIDVAIIGVSPLGGPGV
jgi:hypothetical protein